VIAFALAILVAQDQGTRGSDPHQAAALRYVADLGGKKGIAPYYSSDADDEDEYLITRQRARELLAGCNLLKILSAQGAGDQTLVAINWQCREDRILGGSFEFRGSKLVSVSLMEGGAIFVPPPIIPVPVHPPAAPDSSVPEHTHG
jgi:hypothetical protein